MSGWLSALVEQATAVSIADDSASTDKMRTYVRDDCLTDSGTNAAASRPALATKTTVKIRPRRIWTVMSVYVRLIRELIRRVALSPMMTQPVLGSPSLKILATTPM